MNSRFNTGSTGLPQDEFGPVCRFGPGGDFINDWPPGHRGSIRPAPNSLAAVLARLSKIINALTGPAFDAIATPQGIQSTAEQLLHRKGKLEYAAQTIRTDKSADAPPAPIVKGDSKLPAQSMLFPDDSRVGIRPRRKPNHHIRTYCRAAKKSFAFNVLRQGSLFEPDLKSAQTA